MLYTEFIDFCRTKDPVDFEVHHIEPTSIGGLDIDDNKIKLSGRDHYNAHKLLALEHPYNLKLQQAWWQLCVTHKEFVSRKDYAEIRRRLTTLPKQRSAESRLKRSQATKRYMDSLTPEQKENWKSKISQSNKEFYALHPESKEKISKSLKEVYRRDPQKRLAAAEKRKGKSGTPHTLEFKEALSKRQSGRKWFTNGSINVFEYACPEGFIPGITRKDRKHV